MTTEHSRIPRRYGSTLAPAFATLLLFVFVVVLHVPAAASISTTLPRTNNAAVIKTRKNKQYKTAVLLRGGSDEQQDDNNTCLTLSKGHEVEQEETNNKEHVVVENVAVESSLVEAEQKLEQGHDAKVEEVNPAAAGVVVSEIRQAATELRMQGKELHDQGDFGQAAAIFEQAANTLLPLLSSSSQSSTTTPNNNDDVEVSEEYATCRLHEALCHLKGQEFDQCIQACTKVLQDDKDDIDADADVDTVTETTTAQQDTTTTTVVLTVTPAVRARAYHRRAKAKLGLEDDVGALQDARSAAFLGDRKAVALYGRLMRESSPSSSNGSPFESILSPSPGSSSSSSSASAALLESLLNKSSSSSSSSSKNAGGGGSPMGDFSPASLLMGNNPLLGLLGAGKNGNGGGGGSMAKSVLLSVSKRLEDESTQNTICMYLQRANKAQFRQLAGMAGLSSSAVSEKQMDSLLKLCHGITPKTIIKTVRTTKRVAYGIQLVRKCLKILKKYRTVVFLLVLLQWTKSAVLRPLPIDKRVAKRALKEAMKASRRL
jgi:Tfp pilus assembly protein PilF